MPFQSATFNSNIILPKAGSQGIQVDTAAPTFGWRDLVSTVDTRGLASVDPNPAVYITGIRQFQFSVNDEVYCEFHIPHDYAPNTDMYIHAHWSHNATTVTGGSVTWAWDISYSKGHNQAAFPAIVTPTVQQNASTTQYRHMIAEVQLSAASPSATQINTSLIEVDGVILCRCFLSANAMTVSGGGVPEPFLHFIDLHYQTNGLMGTKQKAPNFYV